MIMQKNKDEINKNQPSEVQNVFGIKGTKTPHKTTFRRRVKYECNERLAEMIEQANLLPKDFHFSFDFLLENLKPGEPMLLKWHELFCSLPEEIFYFFITSDERIEFVKDDAREFWINNDGLAQDYLNDLRAYKEISDEEFNKIINEDADVISDFLVEYGLYGDDYSYRKQLEKKKNRFSIFSTLEDDEDEYQLFDSYIFLEAVSYGRALERLQSVRDFLLAIIKLADFSQKSLFESEQTDYQTNKHKKRLAEIAVQELTTKKLKDKVLATSIQVNKNGEISFSISAWATALSGVDITRIRICEVCGKIFWANRKDAFACSKQHSKVRQMRLLRSNWKKSGELYVKARKNKSKRMEKK